MTMWKPNTESVLKSELDRYKAISDQFLSYLDEEMRQADEVIKLDPGRVADFWKGKRKQAQDIKEKYLQLINNQSNESKG